MADVGQSLSARQIVRRANSCLRLWAARSECLIDAITVPGDVWSSRLVLRCRSAGEGTGIACRDPRPLPAGKLIPRPIALFPPGLPVPMFPGGPRHEAPAALIFWRRACLASLRPGIVAGHLGGAQLGVHLPRCAGEYVPGFQE